MNLIIDRSNNLDEANHRVEMLATALYNLLVADKVISPNVPVVAPNLIMVAEDYTKHLNEGA